VKIAASGSLVYLDPVVFHENPEVRMSNPSVIANAYQYSRGVSSPAAGSTDAHPAEAAGTSFADAVRIAIAQMGGGAALLTADAQQPGADFLSNVLASMQGASASNPSSGSALSGSLGSSSGQAIAPVSLDQSSATIALQTTIQNLITQLDGIGSGGLLGGSADSSAFSGLADLQQSFNSLVTASGGNPDQASLEAFLKSVAATIQGSVPIGSLLNTSV
jgi:hypothetical protein